MTATSARGERDFDDYDPWAEEPADQGQPGDTYAGDDPAGAPGQGPDRQLDDLPLGDGPSRLARLRQGLAGIRTAVTTKEGIERYLFIFGSVALPLGLLVILLGYLGTARTTVVFEQVPYLVSGGMFGVGLVLAGGFAFFGYWVARVGIDQHDDAEQTRAVLAEQRAQAQETVELLREIRELLAESNGHGPVPRRSRRVLSAEPTAGDSPRRAAGDAGTQNTVFVATDRGSLFHRPDCRTVTGREVVRVGPGEGDREPCKLCDPMAESAPE